VAYDPVVAALFSRGTSRFEGVYEPGLANLCEYDVSLLMHVLLEETDPGARAFWVGRLLDDGADPRVGLADGYGVFHALCANKILAPDVDAGLMRRLVECGADVNQLSKREGYPLQVLITRTNVTDDFLMPIYEVFLEQPDLDVLLVDRFGVGVLEQARMWYPHHPRLAVLLEDYARAHGQEVERPLWFLALAGSYDEFVAGYSPDRVNEVTRDRTLLMEAMGNPDAAARARIARRLIADGADVNYAHPRYGVGAVNLLVQAPDLGSQENLALFRELLAAGVDPNAEDGSTGRPLGYIAGARKRKKKPELDLSGYYEVLLARDDLELLDPGRHGRSVLDVVRSRDDQSDGLLDALIGWLVSHGLEVPPPRSNLKASARRRNSGRKKPQQKQQKQ